jgi:membrane protease YdiL (CAAX protease family)
MEEKKIISRLRREMGKTGWVLLIYYLLVNIAVLITSLLQYVIVLSKGTVDGFVSEVISPEVVLDNGWGYLVAIVIGFVLMLLWKKKEFCLHTIWKTDGRMTPGNFFSILAVFLSAQLLLSFMMEGLEWIFNLFGLSLLESTVATTGTSDHLSMFLYAGIFAPISEEILFRGLLLRMLQPYGKRFAILSTAFLFGIFHGNIIQSPFAFMVGLVLGYVALEYSIGWAMVLHMINNLLVADSLSRLSNLLPPWVGELILALLLWGCAIATVVIVIRKRKEIFAYRQRNPMHPWCIRSFFSAPGVIIFTVLMVLNMIWSVILMVLS